MPEMTYAEALAHAFRDALRRDPRVVMLGYGYGGLTPSRESFEALRPDFPDQVFHPPWSEHALAGAAVGAAVAGLRPIVDMAAAGFVFEAFPQVVNEAPNIHYVTGGRSTVPMVIHILAGMRGAGGAQHSHSPQAMLWNAPGLEIVMPSDPAEVYGLTRAAVLDSDNPTVFVDDARLYGVSGDVDLSAPIPALGKGRIVRRGSDVTVVACSAAVWRAVAAADSLSRDEGLEAEVIDPRTLVPFDAALLADSLGRTGRLVVVDETPRSCGVAGEIAMRAVEDCFSALAAPPIRVSRPDVPVPFSPSLEPRLSVTSERIADAIRTALGERIAAGQ